MWATGPVLHLSMLVATLLMISLGAGPSLLPALDTLSALKVCREDWDSRGRSVSTGRVNPFGCLSVFVLGGCHLPLCGHRDPDRPITYKQWFALPACSQCEPPLLTPQCWLSSLRTVLVQQLHGMLPVTDKRISPHCRYGPRLFVRPSRMIFNIYCWL